MCIVRPEKEKQTYVRTYVVPVVYLFFSFLFRLDEKQTNPSEHPVHAHGHVHFLHRPIILSLTFLYSS
jgi:hypothetical protein